MTIVEEAENDGGIDLQDGELIRSAIEFNDLDVDDILTHRVDVVAIDMDNPKEDIAKIFLIPASPGCCFIRAPLIR